MITFNWTIPTVERELNLGELKDVIKTIHWRFRGTNENGVTFETYGTTSIGEPNPQDFTPWDEVTKTDIVGWLEDILNTFPELLEGEEPKPTQLEQMKKNIESQIELLISPQTITEPIPN